MFKSNSCSVLDKNNNIVVYGQRQGNVYIVNLLEIRSKCLVVSSDDSNLWHRRLGHINMHLIERMYNKNLVDGLPKLKFDKDQLCDACMKGKQVKKTFKHQKEIFTSRPLQLLHMDLVGPTRTRSLGGSYYAYVVVDDYSRFTWVMFLTTKDEAFAYFEILANRV